MKLKRRHGLQKRRHREGKTNYQKRLRMITSRLPRFVVRKSLKNISVQLIEYSPQGDHVLCATTTKELQKKYGWKFASRNTPAAYFAGYLMGKKAQQKNIKKAICDIGLQSITKGSILFSCLKGAVDAGLDIPHSTELMPSADRIQGKHLKTQIPFQEVKTKIDASTKK
ncbi:MAG: 50S ribosomal protein L18 [Nanoarchaeota archaeon]